MTPNVPISMVNFFAVVFYVVVALGAALGVYAAVSLKKLEKRSQ